MHRALTVVVVVALLAGSVPAAATLADGTPSEAEPGASFSGVVGVQAAEVNNEVADRSLEKRLNAAKTNESKASVVASKSESLKERLAELEAKKATLKQAYENGSISKGQYQARLAILAAELHAVERQANQTANVAEKLPEAALRAQGANASEVRKIAQQANRTGGGEVAEAARSVAGAGVGKGLGNAPNASERGQPADVGSGEAPSADGNSTDGKPTDAGAPGDTGNDNDPTNSSSKTNQRTNAGDAENSSVAAGNETDGSTDGGSSNATNQSEPSNGTDRSPNGSANESDNENSQNRIGGSNSVDWLVGGVSVDGVLSGLENTLSDAKHAVVDRTVFR